MWQRLLKIYESLEEIVSCVAMIIGVGIMFIGVVFRYALNSPLSFVDEIAPIFIVWSVLIGYSIALRNDEHIKMDAVYNVVRNPSVKKGMLFFSDICGLLFSLFIVRYGYATMALQYKMGRVTQITEFPLWIAYVIIPIMGIAMAVRYLGMTITEIKSFRDKKAGS